MTDTWKPEPLGGEGWNRMESAYETSEADALRNNIAAARFQATGQAPADHVVDLSASSDPYLTPCQLIALQEAAAKGGKS